MKNASILPILGQLKNYDRSLFRGDLVAGLTTAILLIPQAMAYAMLAGLPPVVGLYGSLVPLAIYGLLGSSRQLAVGPVAMVSLLVASGVAPLAGGDAERYLQLSIVLSLMVGALQLFMGIARLGFLTNFLSHPVVAGFSSAAALIIGFSQLKHLLGISLERSPYVHKIIAQSIEKIDQLEPLTFAIGLAATIILVLMKRFFPQAPRALIVVVAGTLIVWGFNTESVKIVRAVPAGLPMPSWPEFSWGDIKALFPTALTISLVGFMESISVAKSFARRNNYKIAPNQELIALGAANLGGAAFGAYPVTGGFSRTAVNAQAGAKTSLASLITATMVGLALLLFTPLFYYLPKAVLAAIIMTAVFGLVDIKEALHLYRVKKSDLALMLLTFVLTLTLGIEAGIILGVVASLLWFVVKSTRPHYAVLGKMPGPNIYRNVKNYPQAETKEGLLIVRFDAQFYFGNMSFLEKTLEELEAAQKQPVKAVLLDASSINDLDSSAETSLRNLHEDYQRRGIAFVLCQVKMPVLKVMQRSGLAEQLKEGGLFMSLEAAERAYLGT